MTFPNNYIFYFLENLWFVGVDEVFADYLSQISLDIDCKQ